MTWAHAIYSRYASFPRKTITREFGDIRKEVVTPFAYPSPREGWSGVQRPRRVFGRWDGSKEG